MKGCGGGGESFDGNKNSETKGGERASKRALRTETECENRRRHRNRSHSSEIMSLHWNLAVLILLLTPTSFLRPSSSHLPSLLCAHAVPTSPPVTRPRIVFMNEGSDEDYQEYDDEHSSSPSVPSITKSTFVLHHQPPPKPCEYNPCMEDQQPCAHLSEQTGCLCPGVSRADQRPHAPRLKRLVPVRGKAVEVQWCAPSSVVSKYRVVVEGRGGPALEFGEALRRGLVESLEDGDNVCVEAVNKAGQSVPSESSCMEYGPAESSSHGVVAWVIGGGVAFIILLSLAAVILWKRKACSKTTPDSPDGLGNPSYSTEGPL